MPLAPKKPCRICGKATHGGYCQEHAHLKNANRRAFDERRGSAQERGYGARWQKSAKLYLSAHPLCRHCLELGRTTPAVLVDHIIPHRGDMVLFWDRNNWQPLCRPCHDGWKQSVERKAHRGG